MTHLILKKELPKIKMDALLNFLRVWDIEVELKNDKNQKKIKIDEVTLLSEKALENDWLKPEEDKAWQDL
jgi:hypothetical protein